MNKQNNEKAPGKTEAAENEKNAEKSGTATDAGSKDTQEKKPEGKADDSGE